MEKKLFIFFIMISIQMKIEGHVHPSYYICISRKKNWIVHCKNIYGCFNNICFIFCSKKIKVDWNAYFRIERTHSLLNYFFGITLITYIYLYVLRHNLVYILSLNYIMLNCFIEETIFNYIFEINILSLRNYEFNLMHFYQWYCWFIL